jgi:predicted nucleic-acid-binding protein
VRIADANFVLRYLLEDEVDQFETARGVLENKAVFIPFEVLAEVVYVLQSVYEVPNSEIGASLSSLLNYPNLSTSDRDVAMYAIECVARSELDIVDALLVGQSVLRDHEILTFDRKLARMIGQAKST